MSATTSTGSMARHLMATFHYEEWYERRWLRTRTHRAWWVEIDGGNDGKFFGQAETFRKLSDGLMAEVRWWLDAPAGLFIEHRFAPVRPA